MTGNFSHHFTVNNNQPYDAWLGDTFALMKVTDTLIDNVKRANFSSLGFVRSTLYELNWLHEQITKIHISIRDYLRQYSNLSHVLILENTIEQIYELMNSIQRSFGNATIDAVKKSSSSSIARANVESYLMSFSLALADLYKMFQMMLQRQVCVNQMMHRHD